MNNDFETMDKLDYLMFRFRFLCEQFIYDVSEELKKKGHFIGTFDFYNKLDDEQKRIIDQELITEKDFLDCLYDVMGDNNFTNSKDADVNFFFDSGKIKFNVILANQGYCFSLRFSPHQ